MPLWGAGSYFTLSNYNPRLNFLLQSVLALAGENSLKVSLGVTSADPHHCGRSLAFRLFVCLFSISYFLQLSEAAGSSRTFPAPFLELDIYFSKELRTFYSTPAFYRLRSFRS